MFDSLTPSEPVARSIDSGVRRGTAACRRRKLTRLLRVAPVLPALFVCNAAMAQVDGQFDGTVTPTPLVGATSPLGVAPGAPTGIPLGAIEITSPGVSPVPTGVTGTITIPGTSGATACSAVATSPSEMFGSAASFDGGGMGVGTAPPATAANSGTAVSSGTMAMSGTSMSSATPAAPLTSEIPVTTGSPGALDTSGMSGMCGSGSSSLASSSSPTSTLPTAPGGGARTGLPLGSFEMGNLGVSSTPAVPVPSVLPVVGPVVPTPLAPTLPTVSPTTPPTNPACATTGTTGTTGTIGAGGIGSFAGAGNAGITGTSISARTLRQFILCQRS